MANNTPEVTKVTLYSYSKVWNVEKKVYALFDVILPAPINPYTIIVFIFVLLGFMCLEQLIPILAKIPTILRYMVLPYLSAQYLMKKKLDGKNPLKYLLGIILYLITERGFYFEKFTKYPLVEETIKIDWKCSKGGI